MDEYDYLIVGDGSGHQDGFGGYGAIAISARDPRFTYITSFGTATHMSVARAEFSAVLHALHSILMHCGIKSGAALADLARRKPTVYILSDNESLIGNLVLPEWAREANLDLWAMLGWYEKYFTFKAAHIPRATLELHKTADSIASGLRLEIKHVDQSVDPIKDRVDLTKAMASEAAMSLTNYANSQTSAGNF